MKITPKQSFTFGIAFLASILILMSSGGYQKGSLTMESPVFEFEAPLYSGPNSGQYNMSLMLHAWFLMEQN